jgi:hypothetical protein
VNCDETEDKICPFGEKDMFSQFYMIKGEIFSKNMPNMTFFFYDKKDDRFLIDKLESFVVYSRM